MTEIADHGESSIDAIALRQQVQQGVIVQNKVKTISVDTQITLQLLFLS
ncbi:MAG: hypothetical protein AAF298_15665 [Cyanobacteria bacterium P01_A01_bin.40]